MTTLSVLDEVAWEGRPVPGARTRALLRALVEAGPRGATEATLVGEIWGIDEAPANPTKALQVVVSRARATTAARAIERTPTGYRLGLTEADVDAWSLRPTALRLAREQRYAEALPLLEKLDPGDDVVVEALVRAVAAVHGVPAALERYETYRESLAERLGVDPSPALRTLHAELLARDRPVRSGLRHDAGDLIGREPDVAALSALLKSSRVVTILGPGGLGKTSLAQLLAHRAEQPVVHVVELVSVTSADDLVGEVGSALGVRDSVAGRRVLTREQRADVRSRIAQQLDGPPTLLVLDNCEHIVAAVADLVAFLVMSVRDLTVLTTSRAPLAIGAERVYPLGQLGTYDGSELFRRRAQAARPGVRLDEDLVAEIVTRLDGLPLAIELAAVKVRAMSVEDIAKRLGNRFDLLRGGDRNAPDRHQTLTAVIDWSWNLLADRERRALRWLSVFHDGFTLDAAETMLGPDGLGAVEELVEQSLLAVVDTDHGVRYRMLETVREFGRMRLADAGEDAAARAAQRSWAVAYADRWSSMLYSPDQIEAMDALRAEEGNLADILRQALGDPDPATVVRVFSGLGAFWSVAGNHPRVIMLVGAVTAALADWDPPPELLEKTRLTVALAFFGATLMGGPDAEALCRLLDRIGRDADDPRLRTLLEILYLLSSGRGDLGATIAAMTHDADPRVRATAYQFQGHERENAGDPEGAIESVVAALDLRSDQDGPWSSVSLHAQLSGLYAQVGRMAPAAEHAAAAVATLERLGASDDVFQAKAVLAMHAIEEGRLAEARALLEAIESSGTQVEGWFGGRGAVIGARACLALAEGRTAAGLRLYREGVAAMSELRFPGLRDGTLMPWMLATQAIALAAYVRYGEGDDGADLYADIAGEVAAALDMGGPAMDFPVAGLLLFSLGLWALLREALPAEDAVRLLVLADRFAYARSVPMMRWEPAAADAERVAPGVLARIEAEYGDRRGSALLDEARAVVARLFQPAEKSLGTTEKSLRPPSSWARRSGATSRRS